MAWPGETRPYLRVFVDPLYHRTANIPDTFEGYDVVVESRQAGQAQWH